VDLAAAGQPLANRNPHVLCFLFAPPCLSVYPDTLEHIHDSSWPTPTYRISLTFPLLQPTEGRFLRSKRRASNSNAPPPRCGFPIRVTGRTIAVGGSWAVGGGSDLPKNFARGGVGFPRRAFPSLAANLSPSSAPRRVLNHDRQTAHMQNPADYMQSTRLAAEGLLTYHRSQPPQPSQIPTPWSSVRGRSVTSVVLHLSGLAHGARHYTCICIAS